MPILKFQRERGAPQTTLNLGAPMKTLITAAITALTLALSASAIADPGSPENGCHGYYTTLYKQQAQDRGAQGTAIGGRGNSDRNPANGQAHSQPGRGATLQEFLAAHCGVGSAAPSSSPQPAAPAPQSNSSASPRRKK